MPTIRITVYVHRHVVVDIHEPALLTTVEFTVAGRLKTVLRTVTTVTTMLHQHDLVMPLLLMRNIAVRHDYSRGRRLLMLRLRMMMMFLWRW